MQNQIIGISQNRSLAGVPHVWDIIDSERAECHMPEDIKLILRKTMTGDWHLGGHPDHRMYFQADSIESAIGTVIYRKFASHPSRRVRASELARAMNDVRGPTVAAAEGLPTDFMVVPSQSKPGISYLVDRQEKTCTCPDHHYRKVICKHLLAAIELLP